MTWKEKKAMENRKVVSLGGKVSSIYHVFIALAMFNFLFHESCSFLFDFNHYNNVDVAGSQEAETASKRSTSNDEKTKRTRSKDITRGW